MYTGIHVSSWEVECARKTAADNSLLGLLHMLLEVT